MLIDVFQRDTRPLILFELRASSPFRVESIPEPFQNATCSWHVHFRNQVIQIELRSKVWLRNRARPERNSLQHCKSHTFSSEAPYNLGRLSKHLSGSLCVVNHIEIQLREHLSRKQITELQLNSPIEKIQRETTEIQPPLQTLPIAR